jgi:hypothetical protein
MPARQVRIELNHALGWIVGRLLVAAPLVLALLLTVDWLRPGLAIVARATLVLVWVVVVLGGASLLLWLALTLVSVRTRRHHRGHHGT